ncbi:MAG: phage portal protein [Ruminococcus sp.]|nr:phage portal protein [Ruminococcus sp.]
MNISLGNRIKRAWNAFTARSPTYADYGAGYGIRPDRARFTRGNERTVVTSVYNRIALDVASVTIQHVKLDENGRFKEVVNSELNYCLNTEANIDQTGRAFIQDVVMSVLDEGCAAIVPVDTGDKEYAEDDTRNRGVDRVDIYSLRVGKIIEWYPEHIRVRLYNDRTGHKEELTVPKTSAAIIENPLYAVINEPNSTMQRLIRKLSLLDAIDEQSGAGKLDLIIQLPYVVKTEARRQQAENRRQDIERQLAGSKYGIAYTDGTERITQLNRPLENNLMNQIEYLTSMLYSQLGLCREILDGTADDKVMTSYYNRSVEPFVSALTDEMNRKFLSREARDEGEAIKFFRDPFRLISVTEIADIADKFTRNEIMSTNEFRPIIGLKPSDDPKADELLNKNISHPAEETTDKTPETSNIREEFQNGEKQDSG